MNYIQDIAEKIKTAVPTEKLPDAPSVDALFAGYAALLLAKGEAVTAEDVHNAWAAWMSQNDAAHSSIKPFSELSSEVQLEDEPFVEAIRQVARSLSSSRSES